MYVRVGNIYICSLSWKYSKIFDASRKRYVKNDRKPGVFSKIVSLSYRRRRNFQLQIEFNIRNKKTNIEKTRVYKSVNLVNNFFF